MMASPFKLPGLPSYFEAQKSLPNLQIHLESADQDPPQGHSGDSFHMFSPSDFQVASLICLWNDKIW